MNANPSWNQVDARLLPAMKGGKKDVKIVEKVEKCIFMLKMCNRVKIKNHQKIKNERALVGTDLVTGLNTTDTNEVAFGTTGGTSYMLVH